MNQRSQALAAHVEAGARALAAFASSISDAEWEMPRVREGREVGGAVNREASVYRIRVELATALATARVAADVIWEAIHTLNRRHAAENGAIRDESSFRRFGRDSWDGPVTIAGPENEELNRKERISICGDAPLTHRFFAADDVVTRSHPRLPRVRIANCVQRDPDPTCEDGTEDSVEAWPWIGN